jgi:hypothetical protein
MSRYNTDELISLCENQVCESDKELIINENQKWECRSKPSTNRRYVPIGNLCKKDGSTPINKDKAQIMFCGYGTELNKNDHDEWKCIPKSSTGGNIPVDKIREKFVANLIDNFDGEVNLKLLLEIEEETEHIVTSKLNEYNKKNACSVFESCSAIQDVSKCYEKGCNYISGKCAKKDINYWNKQDPQHLSRTGSKYYKCEREGILQMNKTKQGNVSDFCGEGTVFNSTTKMCEIDVPIEKYVEWKCD